MDGSEHPLVLGPSLDGNGPALVHMTRNFVPGTVQNATNGMLYHYGGDDDTFYLLPALEGEQVYFQGQLEEISAAAAGGGGGGGGAAGGDTECVALFDEATGQWKLEVVTYRLAARLQRGSAPGSHLLLGAGGGTPQAAAATQPEGGRAAGGVEPLPSGAFGDELHAALFGDEEEEDGQAAGAAPAAAAPPSQQQLQQHAAPPPQQQPPAAAAAVAAPVAPAPAAAPPAPAAAPAAEEEDDALWDDALPSLPAAKAAPAAPAAPAAEAPRRRGAVLEDRADGDGGGGGECSEDDSDGCGMEAF